MTKWRIGLSVRPFREDELTPADLPDLIDDPIIERHRDRGPVQRLCGPYRRPAK
jgi:hypothetical protein